MERNQLSSFLLFKKLVIGLNLFQDKFSFCIKTKLCTLTLNKVTTHFIFAEIINKGNR